MGKRRRANWPLRWCFIVMILIVGGYTFVIPAIELALAEPPNSSIQAARQQSVFTEQIFRRGMTCGIAFWFLFLGASIGSFLNVVVYRMPLGRSLVSHGSFCPYCRTSIRSTDNVPVIGWIKLRGRCRACRLPISSRYPLVEALVGGLFLSLFFVQLGGPFSSLPTTVIDETFDVTRLLNESRWDLLITYLIHCLLLSLLVSALFINVDGNKIPIRLALIGIGAAIAFAVCSPNLMWYLTRESASAKWAMTSVFPIQWTTDSFHQPMWLVSLETCLLGMTVGSLVGLSVGTISQRHRIGPIVRQEESSRGQEWHPAQLALLLAWCGAFLGWQAVFSVTTLSLLCYLIAAIVKLRPMTPQDVPVAGWILFGVMLHLILWSWLDRTIFWPGARVGFGWMFLGIGFAVVLAIIIWTIHRPKKEVANLVSETPDTP